MGNLEVLSPGLLTSVQDFGRGGREHLGISPSGAADPLSLEAGNRLLGNPPGAPALEMTLLGATLRFDTDALFSLAGAEMGAALSERPLSRWQVHPARAGEILRLGHATSGCRAYLCIQGGIDVPLVLGSASTHLQSRIGGFEGRGLKKGDRLRTGELPKTAGKTVEVAKIEAEIFRKNFRVTRSVHTELFEDGTWSSFLGQEYVVSEHSNRLGLRLEGVPLGHPGAIPEVITAGVSLGTIQISSEGNPTLLFVEQQLTGGYPQIACVITPDLAAIGQLKPRDRIRFEETRP